jgi:hypothetical protein
MIYENQAGAWGYVIYNIRRKVKKDNKLIIRLVQLYVGSQNNDSRFNPRSFGVGGLNLQF